MASFALGLTKTAMDRTLSRVKSAIKEEAKLKDKVQHDLVFITDEFQTVRAFLSVANKEHTRDEVGKTWMKQLRDLAFDVEDCVEFVVHLENKKLAWCWRLLPSFVRPPRHLDEAAEEIKLLKARVEDVCQRNLRYNIISSPDSRSKAITPAPATASPSAFQTLRQVWEAAGKIHDHQLQELVARESIELQVISVWGSTSSGGDDLGATSIIGRTYSDPGICREFKTRAWIKLVRPFNPDELAECLLAQFCRAGEGAENFRTRMRAAVIAKDDLAKAELMQQLMKDKRYLVVLEAVSTVADWDDIKMYLPDCKNGSRIIVSTHDLEIAFVCTGKPYLVSELRRFSHGHSLCAFFRKVSVSRCDVERQMMIVGELIQKNRGIISVWGSSRTKSDLVQKVYEDIRNKQKGLSGLEFGTYGWVPAYWFDSRDMSEQVYLELLSSSCAGFIAETKESDLVQRCREFLREKKCLVIIDGLRSIEDWDLFKATFLSEPIIINGCIVVITNEENVAKHCVGHQDDRVFKIKYDLEANSDEHYGYRDNPRETLSTKREEAREWIHTFQLPRSHQILRLGLAQLVEDPKTVVSVWGISGAWKSDIVKNCYYHHKFHLPQLFNIGNESLQLSTSRKFTAYSWANVPRPFNLREFSQRLLLDFYSYDLQAQEMAAIAIMQGQDPIEWCSKLLRQENCFLVIDGLRSTDDWNLIKKAFFPQDVNGCVVVITHEATVATHCAPNENNRINVKCVEEDEALNIFKKEAWDKKTLTPEEMAHSEVILSKCGGLPEVIAAVGGYCKSSTDRLKRISGNFMRSLETDVPGYRTLKGPFAWMQSYFDTCSDTLRPCIFYLSVFPIGQNFRRRRVLRRWIAEGYTRDRAGITAEEDGQTLFSNLIKLSIIQVQRTPSNTQHLFSGFFHEYIISRPMEDNLVFTLEGHCTLSSRRVGQHLTIRKSWDRDRTVFEIMDLSRLRSLTIFGQWRPFFISPDINMRLLRVLDLEDTSGVTDADFEQIVKLVPRLKFLSLRGCGKITNLPDSLGRLRQLQTLDVTHTSIVALSPAIIKLQKLRYLRAGNTEPWDSNLTSLPAEASSDEARASTLLPPRCGRRRQASAHRNGGGVKVPSGIWNLALLQTLSVVHVGGAAGVKAICREISRLTHLRKLGVSGISRESCQDFFSAIAAHAHLESLSVRLDKDKGGAFCCLDVISSNPPSSLKSLKLYGHVQKLPAWVSKLDQLNKVDLEMTISSQEDTGFFALLPSLRDISGRITVKPIGVSRLKFGSFVYPYWNKKIQVFRIVCTSELKVSFGDYITENTELLVLHCCHGSSLRISGLEHLRALKEVWLKGSYGDELKQQLEQQLSQHPNGPVLKQMEQPRTS